MGSGMLNLIAVITLCAICKAKRLALDIEKQKGAARVGNRNARMNATESDPKEYSWASHSAAFNHPLVTDGKGHPECWGGGYT